MTSHLESPGPPHSLTLRGLAIAVLGLFIGVTLQGPAAGDQPTSLGKGREVRELAGWNVHIDRRLLEHQPAATAEALELLEKQLEDIVASVPAHAVAELRKVPLWMSPPYPGTRPRAEYHPGAGWLREHGRNPKMAKAVEFTNVDIFAAETRRMPNFALHELAHAYHDRVLPGGYGNSSLRDAFERMKASGRYQRVERRDSEGRTRLDRAYALTNPQEYFAETSEAFFATNDFYPYTREQLEQHDPAMVELLKALWRVPEPVAR